MPDPPPITPLLFVPPATPWEPGIGTAVWETWPQEPATPGPSVLSGTNDVVVAQASFLDNPIVQAIVEFLTSLFGGVILNAKSLILEINETFTLKDKYGKRLLFESDAPTNVSVNSDGLVTALGAANRVVIITATSMTNSSRYATCKVTVWPDATRAAEIKANTDMQSNVLTLLNKTAYKDYWDSRCTACINASKTLMDHRKHIMKSLLAEAQGIMGTSANTSEIIWFDNTDPNNGKNGGFYERSENKVHINQDRLSEKTRTAVMRYVFHELRHCYQYEAYEEGKHTASKKTRQTWMNNYANYIGSGEPGHMQQAVEFDAYYFADQYDKTSWNNNKFGEPKYWENWFSGTKW